MCGIAGILEFDSGRKPSAEALQRMAGVLAHRGPDEEGFHHEGPVGLAHRRLSIIDLVSGQQPMGSPDRRVWLVFNGEIYNFPELRGGLEGKGHRFRTSSDTEVLLALYLEYGLEAFAKLNGMFACAFWDSRENRLVLAQDRFGKKPLFYYQDQHRFLFGSEIKALLASGMVERKINTRALHEYLSHSYIVVEDAIIDGVRRLPPAHLLVVRNGELVCRPYWEFRFRPVPDAPREEEAAEHLEGLLRQSVRRRLMSDVPLGAFLSGGLDSSAVVSIMASLSTRPVKTFTIGFEESDFSEVDDARVVARHLGTDHHEIIVKPSALEILPNLVWYLDEPFGDSSAVPTYYVCQAARRHVTVALSGDGGDEVFAGYKRYMELGRYQRAERIPRWIRQGIVSRMTDALPFTCPGWNYLYALGEWRNGGLPETLGIFPYIREELYSPDFKRITAHVDPFETTNRILQEARSLDPVSRYQYMDTLEYLPFDILTKVDRMSMANSLEVRAPLLDYPLVEYMASLPISFKLRDGISKYIFRRICEQLLPPTVLEKKKQGFAIPKGDWFQKELRSYAEEILLDRGTLSRGYFDAGNLRRMLRHHATGRRDYSNWIWCLIVLEIWFRVFLDKPVEAASMPS